MKRIKKIKTFDKRRPFPIASIRPSMEITCFKVIQYLMWFAFTDRHSKINFLRGSLAFLTWQL